MAGAVEDKGPLTLGVAVSMLAIGGIFIIARIITRTIIKPQFGLDDSMIIISWFFILAYDIAEYISISHGYGKHIQDLTREQYSATMHAEVVGQAFAICSMPFAKASVAWLLLRIFPGQKLRWFWEAFVAVNAVFFYLNAFLIVFQYQPIAYLWDRSIEGGHCYSPWVVINVGFLAGVTGALTDFVFAILPWFYVRKLKMSLKERISVGIALSMGVFAGICSVFKIYYTSTVGKQQDYAFATIPLVIWSSAEMGLINVGACIPTLRPFYLLLTGKNLKGQTADFSSHGIGNTTHSGRFERLPRHKDSEANLTALRDYDHNIYQTRRVEVEVSDNEDRLSKPDETGINAGATVLIRHSV